MPRRYRYAEDRKGRLGGEHSRQVGGAAGTGDDARQTARRRAAGIGEHRVGRAMRRHNLGFIGHAECGKLRDRMLHHFPVGFAAHDHADLSGLLLSSHLMVLRFASGRAGRR